MISAGVENINFPRPFIDVGIVTKSAILVGYGEKVKGKGVRKDL
ncbi:hypothetical protein FDUTEX481_07100 [Tolypothrix sp. PCC 7601]|nr:hypothetical protein FDUTEX481_07100 [Tolypothrix sp. PCC 7601]